LRHADGDCDESGRVSLLGRDDSKLAACMSAMKKFSDSSGQMPAEAGANSFDGRFT
jgi:hypothetical protein